MTSSTRLLTNHFSTVSFRSVVADKVYFPVFPPGRSFARHQSHAAAINSSIVTTQTITTSPRSAAILGDPWQPSKRLERIHIQLFFFLGPDRFEARTLVTVVSLAYPLVGVSKGKDHNHHASGISNNGLHDLQEGEFCEGALSMTSEQRGDLYAFWSKSMPINDAKDIHLQSTLVILIPIGHLHFPQVSPASVTSRTSSSLRMTPKAFSSWQETAEQGSAGNANRANNSWTATAAALAGALTMGAGTIAACDAAHSDFNRARLRKCNVVDPRTFPTPDEEDDAEPLLDLPSMEEPKDSTTTSSPFKSSKAGGLKDPMTIYAKMAVKQALKEEQQATKVSARPTTPQATSPTEDRKNRQLEHQKEAMTEHDALAHMTPEELKIEEAARKAKQHSGGLKLFSGNGNMALALEICRYLGINLGKATVGKFADGECNVVVHENVRGKDCYVIQPTCPPVNDNMMELLLMVSTLRRASARRITVVIPYYGYARQDRKMQVCC
jgi:hypothetical protein